MGIRNDRILIDDGVVDKSEKMTNYWGHMVNIRSILTVLAVAPFLLGMIVLAFNLSLQTAEPALVEQAVRLSVKAILALVPLTLGSMLLYAFFQFAEEMA